MCMQPNAIRSKVFVVTTNKDEASANCMSKTKIQECLPVQNYFLSPIFLNLDNNLSAKNGSVLIFHKANNFLHELETKSL